MININWILDATKGKILKKTRKNYPIKGFSTDTRIISEDEVFIALKGEKFDGHDFIEDAIKKGVKYTIVDINTFTKHKDAESLLKKDINIIGVENTYKALQDLAYKYRRDFLNNIIVIGITGSSGKTTVKNLIALLLSIKYNVHVSPKSYNNLIGLPLTILNTPLNTQILILEMGMNRKGEILQLSSIAMPNIAVITNIGWAHVGLLGSQRAIAEAKSEIFSGMPEDGVVFLNKDTPFLDILEQKAGKRKIIYFSKNDIKLVEDLVLDGMIINVYGEIITVPIIGEHNLYNLSAALKVSEYLSVTEKKEKLLKTLKELKLPSMRMEVLKRSFTVILDCYNANPDSMKSALTVLSKVKTSGKKIAVLGDMLELGTFSEQLHKEIAEFILQINNIDYVLTYGEYSQIIPDMLISSGFPSDRAFSFLNKVELADALWYMVKPGDVVLFKASRGMKLEEVAEYILSKEEEKV